METKAPRKAVDWEAVELQYRAGIRSLKEIGKEFGVSDAGIIKRAKKDGWTRDLKAKIQAKADAKVSAALVSGLVSARTKANEQTIIEVNAQAVANVRMAHRTDIARMRALVLQMLGEIEHETDNLDLYEELGDLLRAEDDKGQDKRNDIYRKVISSASRIDSMKKLAETLKVLIGMEREAYGIKGDIEPTGNALTDFMQQLSGRTLKPVANVGDDE